jgi:hypothetical protein
VPAKVWHGAQDHLIAPAHGRWLAEHIPGAEADLNDADGHLTVAAERIGDVHEWLAATSTSARDRVRQPVIQGVPTYVSP